VIEKVINSISSFLLKLESKIGLAAASFLLSLMFAGIAMLYVQPVFTVKYHGVLFSVLSEQPFNFGKENHLQYRILGPLLGYLFFLRGILFYLLPLTFIFMFPGIVYYSYRKKNFEAIDSFFLTCFISFSCVLLLPLVAPGYTDIITWTFIFLAFNNAKKTLLSALFFSLALLNHESSIAMLPGLILYSYWLKKSTPLKIIGIYLMACVPHFLYRLFVNVHASPLYTVSYYLSENNLWIVMHKLVLFLPAAIFFAFKLWWIFPLCFIAWSASQRKFIQCLIIVSILTGGIALAFIGYDFTRMIVIAFPAVLLSYEWFGEILEKKKLRKLTLILFVLNFFVLQYYYGYDGAVPMFPWILN
jgi:hypothetical protein